MMTTLRMMVRADAGPAIGTGHVMRCLALAESIKQNGGSVVFVCGNIPSLLQRKIERLGFQVYQIANSQADALDVRDTAEIAKIVSPNWVMVDGYRFDDHYQGQLKKRINTPLMAIDDFGHAKHSNADLLLNQNVYASASQYSHLSDSVDLLTGPRYTLLRQEFGTSADQLHGENRKKIRRHPKRILVTFGGADPDNWTAKTLGILSGLKSENLSVDAVVGPCFEGIEELSRVKSGVDYTLRVHRNVDRMADLINSVDLAITAGGTTCYELARCGVPAVIVAIADNQLAVAKKFGELGLAIDMGDHQNVGESELLIQIRQLIRNREQRRKMSIRGQELVDGRGAERIVRRMVAGLFSFRTAEASDSELLYGWRNDPEVRAVSFSEQPVSWNDHQSWFRNSIRKADRVIWIANDAEGNAAGQLRFDLDRLNNCALISVSLDYAYRGKGIGTALIAKASRRFLNSNSVDRVVAQIKPTNTASQVSFQRAGFRPVAPTTVAGNLAHQFVLTRADLQLAPLAVRRSA